MFPPDPAAFDDLVVEGHVLDVERDVLLGLPVDGLGQLLRAHLGQRDLLDDHGVAGNAGGDVGRLDLLRGEEPLDGVDHRPGVHDRAVDDRLRRQRLHPDVDELVLRSALAAGLELDGLHGRRSDVEPDQPFFLAEQSHEFSSR